VGPSFIQDLRRKERDDEQEKLISKELVTNTKLRGLYLQDISIGDSPSRLQMLWSQTRHCPNHDNSIDDVGLEAFGQALSQNDFVEKRSFADNIFNTVRLAARANRGGRGYLSCNTTLERLDLSGNCIGGKDQLVLLTTLEQYNHTLALLNLAASTP
jgi:hypothetical protein